MRSRIQLIYTIRTEEGYIEDMKETFYNMQDVMDYIRLIKSSKRLVGKVIIA